MKGDVLRPREGACGFGSRADESITSLYGRFRCVIIECGGDDKRVVLRDRFRTIRLLKSQLPAYVLESFFYGYNANDIVKKMCLQILL
jgi:hypothetical protein